ncbi:hypothetical protein D3C85_1679220 [compost metagenome]
MKRIEYEWLFICQRHFGSLEEHFQPLTEEMSYRVAQKILQLTQAQWFVLDVGFKHFDISRQITGLMKNLPLAGVAE